MRDKLVSALTDLARDVPASLKALDISERQVDEVHRNAAAAHVGDAARARPLHGRALRLRWTSRRSGRPTASGPTSDSPSRRRCSALIRGGDPVPAYRLSGGSTLPAHGSLRTLWKPVLEPVFKEADEFVVDLRSGAYSSLARIPHAVVVRVITSEGKVVSHFNKAHKGLLARAISTSQRRADRPERTGQARGQRRNAAGADGREDRGPDHRLIRLRALRPARQALLRSVNTEMDRGGAVMYEPVADVARDPSTRPLAPDQHRLIAERQWGGHLHPFGRPHRARARSLRTLRICFRWRRRNHAAQGKAHQSDRRRRGTHASRPHDRRREAAGRTTARGPAQHGGHPRGRRPLVHVGRRRPGPQAAPRLGHHRTGRGRPRAGHREDRQGGGRLPAGTRDRRAGRACSPPSATAATTTGCSTATRGTSRAVA